MPSPLLMPDIHALHGARDIGIEGQFYNFKVFETVSVFRCVVAALRETCLDKNQDAALCF